MISAGVYLFGCLIYWLWASGEVQPWALKESNSENIDKPPGAVTYIGYANEGLEMGE